MTEDGTRIEGELFNETNWFAVMNGQGMRAATHDPVADTLSPELLAARLTNIRETIAAPVGYMPNLRDFIERNCAAG